MPRATTSTARVPLLPWLLTRLKATLLRWYYRFLTWRAWSGISFADVDCEIHAVPGAEGTLATRVYRNNHREAQAIVLYFHGGGWVIGDLRTHDPFCRRLCSDTGNTVISVDYRLAPEHPFPAAALDCIAVARWLLVNKGKFGHTGAKLIVAGDSAGGNLAAVVARQLSDETPGALAGQLLIYPATSHYAPPTDSVIENAKSQALPRAVMEFFWDSYLLGSTESFSDPVQHPLATPLAWDNFADLPPALVITAGLDPLRDEDIGFAQKLDAAGVPCQHNFYADAEHGFVCHEPHLADHNEALQHITDWIAEMTSK